MQPPQRGLLLAERSSQACLWSCAKNLSRQYKACSPRALFLLETSVSVQLTSCAYVCSASCSSPEASCSSAMPSQPSNLQLSCVMALRYSARARFVSPRLKEALPASCSHR